VVGAPLGEWCATMEFVLGPFGCGKDLDEASAMEFTRPAEREGSGLASFRKKPGVAKAFVSKKKPAERKVPWATASL
jgi:hypothetical protein